MLKYTNKGIDLFGTNEFGGSTLAEAQTHTTAAWTVWIAAGLKTIVKMPMLPCTQADGTTPSNAGWNVGGKAIQYNQWVIAMSGFPAEVVYQDTNNMRQGTDPTQANYNYWVDVADTVEGIHPTEAGIVLLAVDYRTAFAAHP